jgi:hypothetical protein
VAAICRDQGGSATGAFDPQNYTGPHPPSALGAPSGASRENSKQPDPAQK